jgi:very-short-patch-repair endonuclease
MWAFMGEQRGDVDVLVTGRDPGYVAGICIHRARRIDERDLTRRHGLPLTAPARTLLDLAEVVPERQVEQALEGALRSRLVRDADIETLLVRSPGRHGCVVLRSLLARTHGPALTRSEAEERFLALVRAARLPPPETNVRVGGYEVDFLWRDARLVVEVDGFAFHSSRAAFERDRRRDAELQAVGFTVTRITWRQISDEPEAVLVRLASTLPWPHQRLWSNQWP